MDNLRKGVIIKGGTCVGFTGRGVIPMTQEEFNALPLEKQLNGSYYITDGTDEIVISDNEVSEKQLWSSQKIATELKTSSNTGVIDIVGTNYIDTSGKVNRYQVINGICYVTMEFQAFVTKSIWDGVSSFFETVLPKPKVQIDIFYDGTQRLVLGNSGLVYGDITVDKRVYASFSYPIA